VNRYSKLDQKTLKKWTKRSAFVKVEGNIYRSDQGRKIKASRLIQGAQPEYIAMLGPWFAALQKSIKKDWSKDNFICFTSGVSMKEAADLLVNSGLTEILEDDIGKFDASIHKEWCKFEVWLAKYFGAPRVILDLMVSNIKTHGTTSTGCVYSVEGTRKSGDPFTSLFNSILNGIMHLYIYCKENNISVCSAKNSLCMLVQGDDNALVHGVGSVKINWKAHMLDFGFESVATYKKNWSMLEFCSNRMYPCDEGYVFAPKVGKVIAKLGYYTNPPHPRTVNLRGMVKGTALGLYNAAYVVPPLRAYLDRILELTEGTEAVMCKLEEWKMLGVKCEPNVETMLALNTVYDWDYDMQEQFKYELSNMELGVARNSPFYDHLCNVDTLGPKIR